MKRLSLILICSVCLVANSFAQQHRPYADERPIHFGFLLGVNMMDYKITPSEEFINDNKYDVRCSSMMPGFSAGFLTDFRLCRFLNLRITPTLHFGTRYFEYRVIETNSTNAEGHHEYIPPIERASVLNIPISLPVYIKWSSLRFNNMRPYVIVGGGVMFDLGADHRKVIMQKRFDAFVEVGFGCDIYLEYFNLSPELKLAIGFPNQITPFEQRPELSIPDSPYTRAIDKMTSRMITLCFNFE